MPVIWAAGDKMNTLERVNATPTASPTADTTYTAANLSDRFPNKPMLFSSFSTSSYIQIDTNMVANGGMETAATSSTGDLGSWTESNNGTGNVTQTVTAGEFSAGSAGMKLDGGTGTATAFQDFNIRSGERFWLTVDMRTTGPTSTGGAAAPMTVRVRNLNTRNFLTTAGAWTATTTEALITSSSSFATVAIAAYAETMSTVTKTDLTRIRVTIVNQTASRIGYADECYMGPSYDLMSVHGHNIDPCIAVTMLSSSSSGFGTSTTEATFTANQPSFFSALSSARDNRYVRLSLEGTPTTATAGANRIYSIGELVLTQKTDPTNDPLSGIKVAIKDSQTRPESSDPISGRSFLYGDHETRTLSVSFLHDSTGAWQEYRDLLYRRSRLGHHPIVICPLSTEAEIIYGKLDPELSYEQPSYLQRKTDTIAIRELPFPSFVS